MAPMMEFFSTENFMPHGTCIFWRPDILALYVGSDLLIGASYYSIPLTLMYFASQRSDLMYRWILWLFVAFIMACGTTHLISIWTLWVPQYAIEGLVKAATAAVSVLTAILLWWIMPKALAIPSRSEIETMNRELTVQVQERLTAEAHVRELNASLERRVAERTAELQRLNQDLQREISERREIEAKQVSLLAELDHRVRNNLASILAMTRATLKADRPIDDSIRAFEQRLMAFSRAHKALSEGHWGPVTLRTILGAALEPYADAEGRNIRMSGPKVALSPESALTMGLIVNEMATNAAKHGGLALPQGSIDIEWDVDRTASPRLLLAWREVGGPAPSTELSEGFGTRFITGSIVHKLGGTSAMRVGTDGIGWSFEIPLDAIEPTTP